VPLTTPRCCPAWRDKDCPHRCQAPTHLRQGDDREDLTLTPAKKFIDATARELYESLDKEACPTERQPHGVKVEGAYFENRDRCCDAIRKIAKKYLQMLLRDEQGKRPRRPRKPLSTDFYHGLSRKERRDAITKLSQFVAADCKSVVSPSCLVTCLASNANINDQ
jgi:hypothetical protein